MDVIANEAIVKYLKFIQRRVMYSAMVCSGFSVAAFTAYHTPGSGVFSEGATFVWGLLSALSLYVFYKYTYESITVSAGQFDQAVGSISDLKVLKELASSRKRVAFKLGGRRFAANITQQMLDDFQVSMLCQYPYYRVLCSKGLRRAVQIDEIVPDEEE